MKAVIMAGGYGTRLQPMTLRTPKCILPLGDKNSIHHIISDLESIGFKEVIVSLNSTQLKVKDYLDSLKLGVKINYCFEKTSSNTDKLGAIGAFMYVVENFGADDYLVVAADNYVSGINYKKFIDFHKEKGADATIAFYDLGDASKVKRFGIGVLDNDDRILRFQEKPDVKEALSNLASTFIYFMSKDFVFNHLKKYVSKELSAGRKPDNVGDLWAYFSKKLKLYGFKFNGFWGDVGQPDYYVETNRRALDRISTNIHKGVVVPKSSKINGRVIIEEGARIGRNVVIIGPCLIGRNVVIGNNSLIGPYTSLLHNASIGINNVIVGSIVFSNVITREGVKINHAIIDGNTIIENDCRIHESSIIGFNCVIGADSQVLTGSKIWPFLKIDKGSIINSKIHYDISRNPYSDIIRKSCYWL